MSCEFKLNDLGFWECVQSGWVFPIIASKPPAGSCHQCFEKKRKPLTPEQQAEQTKQQAEIIETGAKLGWKPEHAIRYAHALIRWVKAGRPTRTDEEVAEILALCEDCSHYETSSGRCKKCGCRILTKGLAILSKAMLGTERCPVDKW